MMDDGGVNSWILYQENNTIEGVSAQAGRCSALLQLSEQPPMTYSQ